MHDFVLLVLVFFHTKPGDWLGETSPKWPILCRVGRKNTTTQSSNCINAAVCSNFAVIYFSGSDKRGVVCGRNRKNPWLTFAIKNDVDCLIVILRTWAVCNMHVYLFAGHHHHHSVTFIDSILPACYWRCPPSMRNRVNETVRCPSVCWSVCPNMGPQQQTYGKPIAACLRVGDIDRLLQQGRAAGECGQCHVVSVRGYLNTDLLALVYNNYSSV